MSAPSSGESSRPTVPAPAPDSPTVRPPPDPGAPELPRTEPAPSPIGSPEVRDDPRRDDPRREDPRREDPRREDPRRDNPLTPPAVPRLRPRRRGPLPISEEIDAPAIRHDPRREPE